VTATLLELLGIARDRGFLGPGDVAFHVEHARAFLPLLDDGDRVLDLGSGGGVPGLVLVDERPDLVVTMLDANLRRTAFISEAVDALGASERAVVLNGRAEDLGRDVARRGRFDRVVSRSFGPPAVVAECSAPFLRVGGRLIVSEPPEDGGTSRWDPSGLAEVGMVPGPLVEHPPATLRLIEQAERCPDRYPRRTGVPTKRPLF
jgi:16S rRNA (guanine527-N7)-methyltransferase